MTECCDHIEFNGDDLKCKPYINPFPIDSIFINTVTMEAFDQDKNYLGKVDYKENGNVVVTRENESTITFLNINISFESKIKPRD